MAVVCQGCGQSFPVPAGYARNKIQCPGCGVICPVPAGAPRAAPAPASRAAATPFDEPPIEADVEEAPPPAPAIDLLMPCRRCGTRIRRLGECPNCAGADYTPLSAEPASKPLSLSLDDVPRRAPEEEEDESAYDLSRPVGPACPKCRREMERDDVVCTSCGYNRKTRKKMRRTYTTIRREWEADRSLANRLGWLAAAQGFHLVMGAIVYALAETWLPAIIMWFPLTLMLCFVLGTYSRIGLTRDERGRVVITKTWRAFFVPLAPEVIEVRGYEGVVSGPWLEVGFLEYIVLITLLPWGIVPGAVWYYYAIHQPHYMVALAQDHGQAGVYVYRGRSQEQTNEIANAVADAAGIRRLG